MAAYLYPERKVRICVRGLVACFLWNVAHLTLSADHIIMLYI